MTSIWVIAHIMLDYESCDFVLNEFETRKEAEDFIKKEMERLDSDNEPLYCADAFTVIEGKKLNYTVKIRLIDEVKIK